MGVVKRLKTWRSLRNASFEDIQSRAAIEARIDAAAYELQRIARDIAAVKMPADKYKTPRALAGPMKSQ